MMFAPQSFFAAALSLAALVGCTVHLDAPLAPASEGGKPGTLRAAIPTLTGAEIFATYRTRRFIDKEARTLCYFTENSQGPSAISCVPLTHTTILANGKTFE